MWIENLDEMCPIATVRDEASAWAALESLLQLAAAPVPPDDPIEQAAHLTVQEHHRPHPSVQPVLADTLAPYRTRLVRIVEVLLPDLTEDQRAGVSHGLAALVGCPELMAGMQPYFGLGPLPMI